MSKTTEPGPRVLVIMGSDSDLPVVRKAISVLDDLEVGYEVRVASAHRTPERAADLARQAKSRGIRVIIAAAGRAAHLAGVLAAQTSLPVLGVPIASGPLFGLDALLATVQMPTGTPVGTLAVDGAANAALLACRILALADTDLAARVEAHRQALAQKVAQVDDEVRASFEDKD